MTKAEVDPLATTTVEVASITSHEESQPDIGEACTTKQMDEKEEDKNRPKGIKFALLYTCILLGCFLVGYVRWFANPSRRLRTDLRDRTMRALPFLLQSSRTISTPSRTSGGMQLHSESIREGIQATFQEANDLQLALYERHAVDIRQTLLFLLHEENVPRLAVHLPRRKHRDRVRTHVSGLHLWTSTEWVGSCRRFRRRVNVRLLHASKWHET